MSFKQNHSSLNMNSIILQTIKMFFATSIMHITVGYDFVFKMVKKGNEKLKNVFIITFYLTNNLECFSGGIHSWDHCI